LKEKTRRERRTSLATLEHKSTLQGKVSLEAIQKTMMFLLECEAFPIVTFILISTMLFSRSECFSPSEKMTAAAAARVGKPPPFKASKRKTSVTSATSSSETSRYHRSRISVVGKAPNILVVDKDVYQQYEPCASVTQRKAFFIEHDDEDFVAVQAIFCGYTASPEDLLRLRSAHV
jgi:hypothetical protein